MTARRVRRRIPRQDLDERAPSDRRTLVGGTIDGVLRHLDRHFAPKPGRFAHEPGAGRAGIASVRDPNEIVE